MIFKKIKRFFSANPFEKLLKQAANHQYKKFLIEWNRGLGDIPLGLYAMAYRIRQVISDSEITFLIREDLREGFSLFEHSFSKKIHFICVPFWKRKDTYSAYLALDKLNINPKSFDVIIEKPDPTHWVRWQLGHLTPKLQWKKEDDVLWEKFPLEQGKKYIAMQPQVETNYNLHRNWPVERWKQLIEQLIKQGRQVILIGTKPIPVFEEYNLLDLRGKTNLFEVLSILKNCCSHFVTPDSGLLACMYYLNDSFPIHIVSLWSDARQGILKQKVASPNSLLRHRPIKAKSKNLSSVKTSQVLKHLLEGTVNV